MRVAVVTDIHGNRAALFAVLNDLQGQAPDQIVFGGDAALFGSHPRECWQRVLDLGWPSVQGNTDRYIADPAAKLATLGPDQAEQADFLRRNIAWAERQLGDSLVAELRRMSHQEVVTSRAGTVLIVHGTPGDDETGLSRADSDADLAANIGRIDADVLVCGHTHTAFVRHVDDTLLVNCGSVGRTHDGLPGRPPMRCWTIRPAAGRRRSAESHTVMNPHTGSCLHARYQSPSSSPPRCSPVDRLPDDARRGAPARDLSASVGAIELPATPEMRR